MRTIIQVNSFLIPPMGLALYLGPTKPDGSVNFECHCVAHLVSSPCGNEFRKAITCQKSAKERDLENGACADEFVEFMECAIKTKCFRLNDSEK